jgi:hypothetical protein
MQVDPTGRHPWKERRMRRSAAAAIVALTALLLATGMGVVPWASAGASGQADLAALRHATARFHDVGRALASGRVDLHLCVDMMGQHYANPNTFSDGALDPVDPEAMVYADDGTGHLRLVAVEWVSTTPGDVMGRRLHLNPTLGVWVLHAWIWSPNPDGMFADMNPRIGNCP